VLHDSASVLTACEAEVLKGSKMDLVKEIFKKKGVKCYATYTREPAQTSYNGETLQIIQ
jgi:hypothetical protein